MTIILSFVMNFLMTVLLTITIAYCWRLNQRIRQLQDSKGEMAGLIRDFSEATTKAQHSVVELKNSARSVVETIQTRIDKAGFLADDLSFMIERGDKLADQLEDNLASGRREKPSPRGMESVNPASFRTEPQHSEPSDTPIPVSARSVTIEPPRKSEAAAAARPAAGAKSTSLENVLEKIASRNAAKNEQAGGAATEAQGAAKPMARLRTQAERELLDALKQVR